MRNIFIALIILFLTTLPCLDAKAATLTVQNATVAGINPTLNTASTGDKLLNDGHTFLVFINANASARTLTLTVQNSSVSPAGYNPLTVASPTVSLPGSGTNGGVAVVGPFGQTEFNDATGFLNYTLDTATGMSVAVISLPRI